MTMIWFYQTERDRDDPNFFPPQLRWMVFNLTREFSFSTLRSPPPIGAIRSRRRLKTAAVLCRIGAPQFPESSRH